MDSEPQHKIAAEDAEAASFDRQFVTPDPPPTPKVPKKGVYILEPGDSPGVVSRKLFGRTHRAVDIARANPDCDWTPGSEITLPS